MKIDRTSHSYLLGQTEYCLEYVKAHWRGDPSLGIRRSRYTVEP